MRNFLLLLIALLSFSATAQNTADDLLYFDEFGYPVYASDTIGTYYAEPVDTVIVMKPMSRLAFLPAIYTHYHYYDNFNPFASEYSDNAAFRWIDEENAVSRNEQMQRQRIMLSNPDFVRYNIATMKTAPKEYYAEVNPKDHTIKLVEAERVIPGKLDPEKDRKSVV